MVQKNPKQIPNPIIHHTTKPAAVASQSNRDGKNENVNSRKQRNCLAAEAVESAALSLQGVDDVK